MDPDANLEEQLELASQIGCSLENMITADPGHKETLTREILRDSERLAQLVEELNEWVVEMKGCLPKAWQPK